MRFLNKIIFINSGSVKYAEIEMDGNVHFIGTQGVGKSTLLRAILFFYNADKTKLGIPREKKRFDEYYFQYQNSYIIYEVVKDNTPYCVLAYKQNGRVAYRFFDSKYKRELFIDNQGRAFESWEQIRKVFGREIYYTKMISSYDEFRKIVYGDNKGLKPEFRKYAILESKQFQNIPRTIQNVLLNTKLEAQFIKETIIKSLNEEEIKIDLSNYSKSHLRDFENELNDIKIWFKENRKGQIAIKKQAASVIDNYRILNFLRHDKKELARRLAMRINFVLNQKPIISSKLKEELSILSDLNMQLEKLKELHKKRELDLATEIKTIKRDIAKATQKQKDYQKQDITSIIQRVSDKKNLENEKNSLGEEKGLLTSKFAELTQKFESLLAQIRNQEIEFVNQKETEKNSFNNQYSEQKEKLHSKLRELIQQIEKDNNESVELARNKVRSLDDEAIQIKLEKEGLKHKVFFKEEIEFINNEITGVEKLKNDSKNKVSESKKEIELLKKEWGFEEKEIQRQYTSDNILITNQRTEFVEEIQKVKDKIEKQKDSLYGWLNDNYPNWENTIGKVIDEEFVLFNNNLQPKIIEKGSTSLFGLDVNLNAIPKKVKTIADYNAEIKASEEKIENCNKKLLSLMETRDNELKRLKLRLQKKINPLKDAISNADYQFSQAENRLKKIKIDLAEMRQKAIAEKENGLKGLENQLNDNANRKSIAEKDLGKIKDSIKRQIKLKENEYKRKIKDLKNDLDTNLDTIKGAISTKRKETEKRILEIKQQQKSEMFAKGADTKRLEELDKRLEDIVEELNFIEQNQTLVIEYQKDKRELFDNLSEWKDKQTSLEHKQEVILEKQYAEKEKVQSKHSKQDIRVSSIKERINTFDQDLSLFAEFKKSEVFTGLSHVFDDINEESDKEEFASKIIEQLNKNHYDFISRFNELQKSITAFVGNFSEDNIFSFKTKFITDTDFLNFAAELKEFVEEDKISQYEKRVNERFADIIHLIGKETNELISKEAEIEKIIKKINEDFGTKNFVGAIRSMEMRTQNSSNKIMKLLLEIKTFNDENNLSMGGANLFSSSDRNSKNQKAVDLLKQLVKELKYYKSEALTLSETFDLQFRIIENDNDSGWVEKLSHVGSEGTDILVKTMINILLLNVFKENASKKFKDFKLHCMMDEVGRLHPNNVKGILKFANDRNILLINGSPTSYNATDYRYTYMLSSTQNGTSSNKHVTKVSRLVKATKKTLTNEATVNS
jgi:hypothetical protein